MKRAIRGKEFYRRRCIPGLVVMALVVSSISPSAAQQLQMISPPPGSISVSQETSILLRSEAVFSGALAGSSRSFLVSGSLSGIHAGVTVISDDGHALLFKPDLPFAAAETIHVTVERSVQTQDGQPIGPLEFQFSTSQVSAVDQLEYLLSARSLGEAKDARQTRAAVAQSLGKIQSGTNTLPIMFPQPIVVVRQNPSDGYTFLTTFHMHEEGNFIQYVPTAEQYLMIVDNSGSPVFYKSLGNLSTDFKVQPNGNLTYYDGDAMKYYELDKSYAIVDSFACGNGYTTDVHELLLLPNGHALLLGQDLEIVNMSSVAPGGRSGAKVIGSVIQELDSHKNVVFQWRSFDHISITDATHEDLTAATIDYIHSNALDLDADNNILLSSRHTDEITKIDHNTGATLWRWGGKNNQFTFINDSIGFSHQHSIRRSPSGTLMLFDDGNYHVPAFSRAAEYAVDEQAKTATLVWQFRHDPDVATIAMGSVQRLSNGNTFIGWGSALTPAATEVRPDGSVAFEMDLPDSVVSYRAFRFAWPAASTTTSTPGGSDLPASYALAQNYPNPFNPSTVIEYSLPQTSVVHLTVYDLLGRAIATLVDRNQIAGTYSVRFDGSGLASGIYFYRLATDTYQATKTMTVLK